MVSASGNIEVFARLAPGGGMPDLILPRTILNVTVDSPRMGMSTLSSADTTLTVPSAAATGEAANRYFVYCSLVDSEVSATGKLTWLNASGTEKEVTNFNVTSAEPFIIIISGSLGGADSASNRNAQIRVTWLTGGKFRTAIGYFGDK